MHNHIPLLYRIPIPKFGELSDTAQMGKVRMARAARLEPPPPVKAKSTADPDGPKRKRSSTPRRAKAPGKKLEDLLRKVKTLPKDQQIKILKEAGLI